jgi:RNA polymerase sigma factor (sigma-70 family)
VLKFTATEMYHQDQQYIDALVNNNAALLDEVYKKFSGKIKWMVLKNHGNETDAADIFQEGLLSIYRKAKAGGFILTCPFEAFLYTVCKCRWLKELVKRKKGGVTLNENEEYNISEDGFKLIAETELAEARRYLFSEKFKELGENCRQLLQMSWSESSMEEVAKTLSISYGYARKKKSECMAKLITLIKQSSIYNSLK